MTGWRSSRMGNALPRLQGPGLRTGRRMLLPATAHLLLGEACPRVPATARLPESTSGQAGSPLGARTPSPARTWLNKEPDRHRRGEARRGEEETLGRLSLPCPCHLTGGEWGAAALPIPGSSAPGRPAQGRDSWHLPTSLQPVPLRDLSASQRLPELTAPGAPDPKRRQGLWHSGRPQGHF